MLAEVSEQEETAEINEEAVETEEVDTSEVEPLMPDFEAKSEVTVQKTEPGDEIDRTGAVNFHITDDALGAGTAKQKFERNIGLQQRKNSRIYPDMWAGEDFPKPLMRRIVYGITSIRS